MYWDIDERIIYIHTRHELYNDYIEHIISKRALIIDVFSTTPERS